MYKKIFFIPLILLVIASPSQAWKGVVVAVLEGDVIRVDLENSGSIEVGLYGIEPPPPWHPLRRSAIQTTTILALGKVVELGFVSTGIADPALHAVLYGLPSALVRIGDTILNEELIRQGMALVSPYCFEAFCKEWEILEYEAGNEKRGMWIVP